MNPIKDFNRIDLAISNFMERYGFILLRYSLAIVFIWFGLLKPLGMSPAEDLVRNTVTWWDFDWFFPLLGWWEVAIGICLIFRPLLRVGILLLLLQMPGAMSPIVLEPEAIFNGNLFALTLEGQYVIKNIVLISAALVVGGTVRSEHPKRKVA